MLGAIFVWFGLMKATATSTIAYFTKLGLPVPTLAYLVTVVIELGLGTLFVIGCLTRPAALVLGGWCIATGLVAHSDFADRNMLIYFYKNVAMAGRFLYAALLGPGYLSVDHLIRRRRSGPSPALSIWAGASHHTRHFR